MTEVEWPTVASLATAAGTLVLVVATFASVRSGNRSAVLWTAPPPISIKRSGPAPTARTRPSDNRRKRMPSAGPVKTQGVT